MGSVSDKVRLLKVNKETIVLAVSTREASKELAFCLPKIKSKIDKAFGAGKIKQFKVKILPHSKHAQKDVENRVRRPVADYRKKVTIDSSEKETLLALHDKELRSCMEDFLVTCKLSKKEP